MNKIVLLVFITINLLSITHSANYEDQDRFKEVFHEETGTWGGFRGENELAGGRFLSLVPGKSTHHDNTTIYKLKIRWTGPELLLINHAELRLLIDGERVALNPSKTYSQHLIDTQITSANNDIYERMDYEVDQNLIKKIAMAKRVDCAIYTPRGRIERHLDRSNQKQFKEFLEKL